MIASLIGVALTHRLVVAGLCLAVVVGGILAYRQQPIYAYPDISSQQVLVISTYPGRAPDEVARQVTIPIELALGSVPNVQVIRSRTIFGLSVISLIFEEGVDKYFARHRVQDELRDLQLPPDVLPIMGPPGTSYGEIYRYALQSDRGHSLMDLRTLNDWVVMPRLRRADGVADTANFGGFQKQFTLKLDPRQLDRYGLTLDAVVEAVQSNNATAGGSVLTRGEMSLVIRGQGLLENEQDIEGTVINTIGGTPIYVRDVADVELDSRIPRGIFGKDGVSESIEGIVLMRRGESPADTLKSIKEEVGKLNAGVLPDGVQVVPFYDRDLFIKSTLNTVGRSVLLGIMLVLLILLATLGSPILALLVMLTIPFSLLFALILMYATGIPIGLLSIGTIDFGILVAGSMIMADSIAHHLCRNLEGPLKQQLRNTVLWSAVEVARPVFYSMLIIICAYLPLMSLNSIEGLLFRPMILTVLYALTGAMLFALFVLPGLATVLLRTGYRDWENPGLRWFRRSHAALLRLLLRGRWGVAVAAAGLLVAVCVWIVPRLGVDYLPELDEGVVWVRANFPEGTSLEETARFGNIMRSIAGEFPEVTFATSQAGRSDSGIDPFTPNRLELMIGLRPIRDWRYPTRQALVGELRNRFREEFPTTRFNFTQPIIDSVNEDTNGTSADLAVEFSGSDPETLQSLGTQAIGVLQQIRGAVDVNIEQDGPQPQLIIRPDRVLCARYNVHIDSVNRLINTALGGEPIGTLYEQERRFDIVARFDRKYMTSPESIGKLPVYSQSGVPIPLSQVATFSIADGQTMVARYSGRRRITVRCDIVGRDQGKFVAEAQNLFNESVQIPEGYQVRWIGMFQNIERAAVHFAIIIPLTLLVMYGLLVWVLHSQREALLVLLSGPFAFLGGVVALYIRDMSLNVATGIGFVAVFGMSLMNGLLLVHWITSLREQGRDLDSAIIDGTQARQRPILMTSLAAILGLLPASVVQGLGSDVQRPLATVIVWGLFSSTLLTLLVIPVLYRLVSPKTASERFLDIPIKA